MGTTPQRAIPFPEPSDLVTNGAQAMEDLATRVEAILDGDGIWRTVGAAGEPPFLNNWAQGSSAVQFMKMNGFTFVRGNIIVGSGSNATKVFDLPVAYRPAAGATVYMAITGWSNGVGNAFADSTGTFGIEQISPGGTPAVPRWNLGVMFPADPL